MIGHDTAIQGLNSLSKSSVRSIDPKEHASHLHAENDRVHMILTGSTVDDILLENIKLKLTGNLNSDDRSSLFGFDGALGTFGSRTLFALALNIIDRTTRKQIDIMRAIRNAAAHSHGKMDYATPAVRTALASIVRNEKMQRQMSKWDALAFRKFHGVTCAALCRIITSEQQYAFNVTALQEKTEQDFQARRRASPETPPEE